MTNRGAPRFMISIGFYLAVYAAVCFFVAKAITYYLDMKSKSFIILTECDKKEREKRESAVEGGGWIVAKKSLLAVACGVIASAIFEMGKFYLFT